MKCLDHTLATPAENLACDEALLDAAEAGDDGEVLRFWEPAAPFVVVGYANRIAVEANEPACRAAGIPILRRCSGGGTVLQAPGCLNYALVLAIPEGGPLAGINGANRFIMERHRATLQALTDLSLRVQGHTDLTAGNLKFSGNAQRRRRHFLLFHGTLLLGMDLSLVERFLAMPSKQPDYRANRPHRDFVANVPLTAARVKEALRAAWDATGETAELPAQRIAALVRDCYGRDEWNHRC